MAAKKGRSLNKENRPPRQYKAIQIFMLAWFNLLGIVIRSMSGIAFVSMSVMGVMVIMVMVMVVVPVMLMAMVPVIMIMVMLMMVMVMSIMMIVVVIMTMMVMMVVMFCAVLHMMEIVMDMPLIELWLCKADHNPHHIRLIRQLTGSCSVADLIHDHARKRMVKAGDHTGYNPGACWRGKL